MKRSALSPQSREIYRLTVQEGLPSKEVAKRLGTAENNVRQVKKRVVDMIAAVEETLYE